MNRKSSYISTIRFMFSLNNKMFVPQFSENNETLSVLTLVPGVEDDGKYLTCRAENKHIQESAIEDKWRLNVQCKLKTSC